MKSVWMMAAAMLLAAPAAAGPEAGAADAFVARLQAMCGKAFAGRIEASEPAGADAAFAGPMVMHVRDCAPDTVRIPFHVGEDRSRTWIISRHGGRLRLKHDHRHEDGSPDALTMYGGDSVDDGSAGRQEFPADAFSKDLFGRTDRAVSIPNVWAVEVGEDHFTYELKRPGRLFRVRFDTTAPVPVPPPAWGAAG